MLLNCGAGGDPWESPGLQGEQTYSFWRESKPWVLTGRTDPEAEAPILWPSREKRRLPGKAPDVGKVWGQEEKGNDRGQDGWTGSLKRPTWIWPNSRRWWKTGGPGVLCSMGSWRVRHDLMTKQQQKYTENVPGFALGNCYLVYRTCIVNG